MLLNINSCFSIPNIKKKLKVDQVFHVLSGYQRLGRSFRVELLFFHSAFQRASISRKCWLFDGQDGIADVDCMVNKKVA